MWVWQPAGSGSHFCWWNREILKPIQAFGSQGEGKIAFNRLVRTLRRPGREHPWGQLTQRSANQEVGAATGRWGPQGELLKRLMLRRTKVERADDLGLPPRIVRCLRGVVAVPRAMATGPAANGNATKHRALFHARPVRARSTRGGTSSTRKRKTFTRRCTRKAELGSCLTCRRARF